MTTSQLGRTLLVTWPDFNDPKGAGQVSTIQASVLEISDNAISRYKSFSAVADSVVSEVEHNFGVNLDQLDVLIYTGSHANFVRVSNPTGIAVPWGIAEKTGEEKTAIEITAPASGGPHTFAVFVVHTASKDLKSTREQLAVSSNITLQNKTLHRVDTSSARTLTLPSPDLQLFLSVKDVTGSASTNNITIATPGAETIDGASDYKIESDYGALDFISDGTNYFAI